MMNERRQEPAVSVQIWKRKYPVTPRNILTAIALISAVGAGVGWFLNRFGPWPTRTEVDASIKGISAAIITVEAEHEKTRAEIGELKSEARLTAQAICAMTRKFAPENTPMGCVPIPPTMQRDSGL